MSAMFMGDVCLLRLTEMQFRIQNLSSANATCACLMTINTKVSGRDMILHRSALIAACRKEFHLPVPTLRSKKKPLNQSFC